MRVVRGENNLAIDAQDEKFVEEALQEWVMTRARHQQEAMRRTPRGVGGGESHKAFFEEHGVAPAGIIEIKCKYRCVETREHIKYIE